MTRHLLRDDDLTPAEQAAMARDYPEVVGSANGLPAAARNAANMLLLKKYRSLSLRFRLCRSMFQPLHRLVQTTQLKL